MSNLNKAILKVARENPEFRRALIAELKKEAAPAAVPLIKVLQDTWDRGVQDGDGNNLGSGWDSVKRIKRIGDELMAGGKHDRSPRRAIHSLALALVELMYEAGYNTKSF